jgi:beta-galactosidase/beta-glucuronidase
LSEAVATHQEQTSVPFPRPQMERQAWISLDGTWDFCSGRETSYSAPGPVQWNQKIIVPFSPETPASGIGDTGFYSTVWYRRTFERPKFRAGHRLILHFEAVDYCATVWVNGQELISHEGGYTPFNVDITGALHNEGAQEIVVRAEDDPADLEKPRGKQDWKLEAHSIWYPRTTGIWQTVWLEIVPATRLCSLQWDSNLERWEICLKALVSPGKEKTTLRVRLQAGDQVLALDTYAVIAGEVHRRIALSDPGIDDYRNTLLWSPTSPTIIDAFVDLLDEEGGIVDSVRSYTAIRSVSTQGDRFVLNGRPLNLRLVLDQGYWPESGATSPNDEALRQDVLLTQKLGFNGVRKHQKIESARFLYWADRLGLLVWEEMPSAYRYTTRSIQRLTREWLEVLERDRSHPCIITWVPFNESWGVPDLPDSPAQRHYVQALYHLTKCIDPSRPVIGNDGWESVATDIVGIHDYDEQPERMGLRYGVDDIETRLLKRERPGGRMLRVGSLDKCGQPIVLTEFGGTAFGHNREGIWGYSQTETADDLLKQYSALLSTVRRLPALAGFCYTQFTDTYQEANGLLYADRSPKVAIHEIALATTGSVSDYDAHIETLWRDQIMEQQPGTRP